MGILFENGAVSETAKLHAQPVFSAAVIYGRRIIGALHDNTDIIARCRL
jgi:hypothetical protein